MTCNNVIMYVILETIPRCSLCSKAGWKPQHPRVSSRGWWSARRSPTRTILTVIITSIIIIIQTRNVLSSLSMWTFSLVRYFRTKINEALRVLCVRAFNGFVCDSEFLNENVFPPIGFTALTAVAWWHITGLMKMKSLKLKQKSQQRVQAALTKFSINCESC